MMNALNMYAYRGIKNTASLPYGTPLDFIALRVYYKLLISTTIDFVIQCALAHRIFQYDLDETFWIMDTDPMNHHNIYTHDAP